MVANLLVSAAGKGLKSKGFCPRLGQSIPEEVAPPPGPAAEEAGDEMGEERAESKQPLNCFQCYTRPSQLSL